MKVLFCTNAFEKVSNGPAKFANLLLNEGENAGLEIRILTEDTTSESQSVYKLDLHIPKHFKLFGQFIRMWKYHRESMKIRKDFHFDILVYNNAMIGLFSYIVFKKTVGMINDDNNAFNSLAKVFKRKAKFDKHVIFYYIEYLASHLSACVIVNSEYLKRNLIEQYGCTPTFIKVMYKGIENKLIEQDRKKSLFGKKRGSILFVKTDFIRGGLYTLINALKGIERHVSISIIGPPKKYHSTLKEMLNEIHIPFELFDYLTPSEIYKKMGQSEIFCVPSKREAFGVANIEAMAMGCKIVSTNVGGIPEAVGRDHFAWLVGPNDPEALKAALVLALDTSIRDKIDDLDHYLENFNPNKTVSNFKNILETCS